MKYFKLYINEIKHTLTHKFILILAVAILLMFGIGTNVLINHLENIDNNYNVSYIKINNVQYIRNEFNYHFKDLSYQLNKNSNDTFEMSGIEEENVSSSIFDVITNIQLYVFDYYKKYALKNGNEYSHNYGIGDPFYSPESQLVKKYLLENEILLEKTNEMDIFYNNFLLTENIDFSEINKAIKDDDKTKKNEMLKDLDYYFESAHKIYKNNDYNVYHEYKIFEATKEVERLENKIKILNESLTKNEGDYYSTTNNIETYQKDIKTIKEIDIPLYEYQLSKQIFDVDSWQYIALNRILDSYHQKNRITILSKSEWEKLKYNDKESYDDYLLKENKDIVNLDIEISKGVKSLKSNKPDRSFVLNSPRNNLLDNLVLNSYIFVIFSILLGAYLIASEFSNGTVKLLLLRPLSRFKLYTLKYLSGFTIIYIFFLLTSIMSFITIGLLNGFSDFMLPYYTDYGTINFILRFIIDLTKCSSLLLFTYTLGYFCSVTFRNVAISLVLPIIYFLVSYVSNAFINPKEFSNIISYSPTIYSLLPDFITLNNKTYSLLGRITSNFGTVSLDLGVIILLISSIIIFLLGAYIFKARDITN